jgi:hypothetical protein
MVVLDDSQRRMLVMARLIVGDIDKIDAASVEESSK